LTIVLEERGVSYLDVLLALLVFLWPPTCIFLTFIGREWRRLGSERRKLQAEAEAERAEGYPPPDPPTT
jgi:hypothetical protein